LFYPLFRVFSPILEQSLIRPLPFLQIVFRNTQAIAPEWRLVKTLVHVESVIMFRVASQPEAAADYHLWAMSAPCSLRRVAKHLQAFAEICAIHGVTFDAVTDGSIH
jgi:hypothetical protein